jgi:hypothetical protein
MQGNVGTDWWANYNITSLGDIYGPLIGGQTVQNAMYNTIQTWMPAYIAEMNRSLGGPFLDVPIHYRLKPEKRVNPQGVEASVLVIVAGTIGEPERSQEVYYTQWEAQASIVVKGSSSWEETQALTYAYTAAIRASCVQHAGLGTENGIITECRWISESYREGDFASLRQVGLGMVEFEVTTPAAVAVHGGPNVPSVDMPAPPVEITSYEITVTDDEQF